MKAKLLIGLFSIFYLVSTPVLGQTVGSYSSRGGTGNCMIFNPFLDHKIEPYYVGLSSNISSMARLFYWDKSMHFSRNKLLNVELETAFNRRFAIKVSANFGIDFKEGEVEYERIESHEPPYHDPYSFNKIYVSPWTYYECDDVSKLAQITSENPLRGELTALHNRDVKYEVGLQPKYYFKAYNNVIAAYVGVGLYSGIMNSNAVDFYHEMDTVQVFDVYLNTTRTIWSLTENKVQSRPSIFKYYRAQIVTGVNLNFTPIIGIGLELAYSTPVKNKGETDKVYLRQRGQSDYTLVREEQFEYTSTLGNLGLRLSLILRIAKRSC